MGLVSVEGDVKEQRKVLKNHRAENSVQLINQCILFNIQNLDDM
jgi:hypothetical protein